MVPGELVWCNNGVEELRVAKDPELSSSQALKPSSNADCIMTKRPGSTGIGNAQLPLQHLGPFYAARLTTTLHWIANKSHQSFSMSLARARIDLDFLQPTLRMCCTLPNGEHNHQSKSSNYKPCLILDPSHALQVIAERDTVQSTSCTAQRG
jgi:hypothetical protein